MRERLQLRGVTGGEETKKIWGGGRLTKSIQKRPTRRKSSKRGSRKRNLKRKLSENSSLERRKGFLVSRRQSRKKASQRRGGRGTARMKPQEAA